jgi:RimJ/RimL family protein N-acetyltransferase
MSTTLETSEDSDNRPSLTTSRLLLRPFCMADAAGVQSLAGMREIASTTRSIEHPYPPGQAEAWINQHSQLWRSGKSAVFAICLKAGGTLLGAIGLEINSQDHNAELGYWIGKPYWSQGYCTESARAVLEFGFTQLGLHKIHAHYMTRNPASGRILEKIGMRREGLFRQHVRKWGVFEDIACYGILAFDFQCEPR